MRYIIYSKADNLYYTGRDWPDNGMAIFNRNIMAAKVYEDAEEAQRELVRLDRNGLIVTEYYR